jgi:hypothetical protein
VERRPGSPNDAFRTSKPIDGLDHGGAPLPPPPPPPPLPIEWATPYGSQEPSYGPVAPPDPSEPIRRAYDEIGSGLDTFGYALLLQLATAGIGGLVLGFSGSGVIPGTTFGGSSALPTLVSASEVSAASTLLGLLGILSLILILVSWMRWRSGAENLRVWGPALGPEFAERTARARADVSSTTSLWIVELVLGIIVALAIAALVFGSVVSQLPKNGTTVPTAADLFTPGTIAAIDVALAVSTILATGLNLLLYAFATRSLLNTIAPYAGPAHWASALQGRRIVLVGALLGVVAVVGLLVPGTGVVAVVPGGLVAFGYYRIRAAYRSDRSSLPVPDPRTPRIDRLAF